MNWKNTWILVGLAAALCAFIMLFERRLPPTGYAPPPPPLFGNFKPTSAASVQIRRGTQFAITLERTNDGWHFTKPFEYPAAGFAVQNFLDALEHLTPATHITTREIVAHKQTSADFGFDPPPIVVVLEKPGEAPLGVRFGARTPANDQIYVEVDRRAGYFVVSGEIVDSKVPRTQHDWRDTALFNFGDEPIDGVEISRAGRAGFKLVLDATNKLWRLAQPSLRADQLQVQQLINKIQNARAQEFVTDERLIDLEPYGLQTPDFEVTLTSGAAAQKVQFGRAPTNDPSRVYARLMARTNIVLVPRSVVDVLGTPYSELRERHLVAFAPEMVDMIEFGGEKPFVVRKNSAGAWMVGEMAADPIFMAQWLTLLSQLQVTEFVKDVVTDFKPYGLDPVQRQYTLRTVVTNAAGPTNVPLAQLAFGTSSTGDRVFARRLDEYSVYAVSLLDYSHMPGEGWQLRDHRVWSFTTNEILRVTIAQNDSVREVLRQPTGEWVAVRGFAREVNPFALEELAFKLGSLNAVSWIARGPEARAQFGFTTNSARLSVDLRGPKPQTLSIEFGGLSPLRLPYALVDMDGQPTVFEFPWQLYVDLQIANLAPSEVNLRMPKARQ